MARGGEIVGVIVFTERWFAADPLRKYSTMGSVPFSTLDLSWKAGSVHRGDACGINSLFQRVENEMAKAVVPTRLTQPTFRPRRAKAGW